MKKQFLATLLFTGLVVSTVHGSNSYTTSTQTKILSGLCFAIPAAAAGAVLFHTPTKELADKVLCYGIGAGIVGLTGWAGYTIINWFTPEGRFAVASGYVEQVRKDAFINLLNKDGQTDVIAHAENAWVSSEFPLAEAFDILKQYRSNLHLAQELFKKVIASEPTESLIGLSQGYLQEVPIFLAMVENAMKVVKKTPGYLAQVTAKNEKLLRIAQQKAAAAAMYSALTK